MLIIPIQNLKVGNVFAKEIKVKGREAFVVTDIDVSKNKLEAKKRGAIHPAKMKMSSGEKVYLLRQKE